MEATYSLLSNVEPSENQLNHLMLDVLEDVKNRAKLGKIKLDLIQREQIKEVFEKYKKFNFKNANQ